MPIKITENNYDFSRRVEVKGSSRALIQADVYMKERLADKSLEILVDFMISHQRDRLDDINPLIVEFLITYLIPREVECNTDTDYAELLDRPFMLMLKESIANLNAKRELIISDRTKEEFEAVVEYTLKCISDVCTKNKSSEELEFCRDEAIIYIESDDIQKVDSEIKLCTNLVPEDNTAVALLKCLLPSLPSEILFSGGPNTLLRMISILFRMNRLIETMTNKCNNVIPKAKFEIFDDKTVFNFKTDIFEYCPFLFKQSFRIDRIKKDALRRDKNPDRETKSFEVSRSNILESILEILPKEDSYPIWNFYFSGEVGRGKGPNKEFYAKVSQDIQRYDLNLWVGEPELSSNGIKYVYSKGGLFPSPSLQLDENSRNILRTLGILMAKSVIDGFSMDLKFSKAFWALFLEKKTFLTSLTDDDICDAIPDYYEFYQALMQLKFEVQEIKNNISLTPDQQLKAISELKYNESKLEDLCITFTLPGYPEIEMINGGKDVYLGIENLCEYIHSMKLWYFYKGSLEKMECIKQGFQLIMGRSYGAFLKEDMIMMFSSIEPVQWTLEDLEKNCKLETNLSKNKELIKRLFSVLSSLSVVEQKQFLTFVTTFPHLPLGGLSSLKPSLTFDLCESKGNQDEALPWAFTCNNLLNIPNYSDDIIFKQKLLLAISEGGDYFALA